MNLPQEIVIKILVEFHGGFSFRNGKLMSKIQDDDARRKMLQRIVPHPNKHMGRCNDFCIILRISELKHYELHFCVTEVDWSDEDESCCILLLRSPDSPPYLSEPLYCSIPMPKKIE